MGSIKEFFPIGKQVRPRDGQSLLIAIVIYIVVAAVVGLATCSARQNSAHRVANWSAIVANWTLLPCGNNTGRSRVCKIVNLNVLCVKKTGLV